MPTIGFYPGTFDPIHKGHVAFAQEACDRLGIDIVYLLPEKTPRGKHDVSDIDKRIEMIKNAVSATHSLSVMKLQSTTFTIDKTCLLYTSPSPRDS